MIDFVIKKDSGRGYVVVRKDGEYSMHAHISTMNGCRQLLYYIHKGLLPKSSYLQGSCRRLLTEVEYAGLKRPKQKYYNKSGHNKRT
jgi:hypothetical protein